MCLPKLPEAATHPVFVADDAFPLGRHLLKPYGLTSIGYNERIFNYRLSRARRISENVFGILVSRFRLFLGCMHMKVETSRRVILAAVTLHNLLRTRNPRKYMPPTCIDQDNIDGTIRRGDWREVPNPLASLHVRVQRNQTVEAKEIRRLYTRYFAESDRLPWQDRVLEVARRRPLFE